MKRYKRLREDFNQGTDSWFDDLADVSEDYFAGDSKLPKFNVLIDFAHKIRSKAIKSTDKGFEAFKKVVDDLPDHRSYNNLKSFVANTNPTTYKKEFKKWEGDHSVISEIFSLFSQAVLYNEV